MSVYALLDCNNFYASCERLFNPKLRRKPIVVLSNNDGCIIARSNEAKALGIPMGEPFFKAKPIVEQHDVAVFSSNYTLYGDMSRRVMATVASMIDDIEIYSIDEAFLDLTDYPNPEKIARAIHKRVSKWTGIPISIGLASSKTLAKLANNVAKKYPSYKGVFYIDSEQRRQKILQSMSVDKIWGVGRRMAPKLTARGIVSAYDLAQQPDSWVRQFMSVTGLRTVQELRGQACIKLEPTAESKKMITVSRSFGRKIYDEASVKEALANFVERAGQKLRSEKVLAKEAYISLYRELSKSGLPNYKDTAFISFSYPTDSSPELMKFAMRAFDEIYQRGCSYKKCGITLYNMQSKNSFMKDLFDPRDVIKNDRLMQTMDGINEKLGNNTIQLASAKGQGKWIARKDSKSSCYTTRWDELLCVG